MKVGRFKGRFLFWENTYEDCGGFQFYANVVDGVVARHRFVRAEALLSWGRATASARHIYAPNLRIQFTENTVIEGNHLWNWNGSCNLTASSNRGCPPTLPQFTRARLALRQTHTRTQRRWSRTS